MIKEENILLDGDMQKALRKGKERRRGNRNRGQEEEVRKGLT